MLAQELFIGAVLGITARLTISALQVAGSVIAQQLGPRLRHRGRSDAGRQQGVMVGNFLTMLGVTLIFATDLHHLVIAALNDSYRCSAPGEIPLIGDVAALTTQTIALAFKIGVQLSAPFLVFGLLFNLGLGVLSRLMPQMQVFFVGLPLSILLGFLILLARARRHDDGVPRLARDRAAPARAVFVSVAWPKSSDEQRQNRRPDTETSRRRAQARRRRQEPGGQHLVRDRGRRRWC